LTTAFGRKSSPVILTGLTNDLFGCIFSSEERRRK